MKKTNADPFAKPDTDPQYQVLSEKLKHEHSVLIDILESMSDAFVSLDENRHFTYMNNKAGRFFRRDPQQIIGKHFWTEFPEITGKPFYACFEKALTEKVPINTEEYISEYDQWVEHRIVPSESGISIFSQDITKRKKGELALKESAERFRILVEQAVDGIFLGDPVGNFIGVNSKSIEMTGYTKEELMTMNMSQLFTEEERKRTPLRYDLLREGKIVTTERMLTRKNGSLLAIEMHTKMMPDKTYQSFFRDITERKKTEILIRESELHYRTIFENTGTATVMIEEDTTISLANTKFEELSGYTKAEIEHKKSWTDFTVKEDLTFMAGYHKTRRINSDGVLRSYEFRFIDRTGNIKDILLTIDLVPGTKKSVASLLDITKRKKAENQVRESEQRYRQLFEHNPAPMIIYERNTLNMVSANEAFLKNYGYSTEQLLSMRLQDLYPEEQKKSVIQLAKRLHGHAIAGEWSHVLANGRRVEIMAVSHDINFENRDCRIAVINDITIRKKAEQALRESEEKYRTVIECATDSIAIIKDGKVQFANPRLISFSGYNEKELIHKSFVDFVIPIHRERASVNYQERISGKSAPTGYEIGVLKKNGEVVHVEATATVFNFMGGPAELVFLHDITERKQIEDKIKQINEELEERVHLRTKQLAEINKELEKVNHTKDKFFSIIAHDLKNPVAVIYSSAEMLLRTLTEHPEDQERLKRYSENILRGTQDGYKLLENLLEWASAQSGIIRCDPQNLDLTESLIECIAGMKLILYNKNINIVYPKESNFVYADKNMVNVVLRNLLSNAVKYSYEGGTITVKTTQKDHRLLTEINDCGVGMTEEAQVLLFRIENKVSTPGTLNERGTGLGLILCKEFISQLGGSIWVESEMGRGSTFKFTLPLKG